MTGHPTGHSATGDARCLRHLRRLAGVLALAGALLLTPSTGAPAQEVSDTMTTPGGQSLNYSIAGGRWKASGQRSVLYHGYSGALTDRQVTVSGTASVPLEERVHEGRLTVHVQEPSNDQAEAFRRWRAGLGPPW